MTTLQNPPQVDRSEDRRFRQEQGSDSSAAQSQQQMNDEMPQADRQQSGDDQTFTVSLDDWFKS